MLTPDCPVLARPCQRHECAEGRLSHCLLKAGQCRRALTLLSTPLVLHLVAGRAMPFANHMRPQGGSPGIPSHLSNPACPVAASTAADDDGAMAGRTGQAGSARRRKASSRAAGSFAFPHLACACHAPASLHCAHTHAPPPFFPVLMTLCSNLSSATPWNAL